MKKILYTILTITILLYLSVNLFQIYQSNHLLNNEAVVNIYPNLPDEKVDEFFLLPKGTFDRKKHYIIYSFVKSDNYELNYYYNLPVYNYSNLENLNCKENFSKEKHYRFAKNEIINNSILYARLSNIQSNGFHREKNSKSILAVRMLALNIIFGKINSIVVDTEGASLYCK